MKRSGRRAKHLPEHGEVNWGIARLMIRNWMGMEEIEMRMTK